MYYEEFKKRVTFGSTTAFVIKESIRHCRYYTEEISDETFRYCDSGTDFYIIDLERIPRIHDIVVTNFLQAIQPANGVVDEQYEELRQNIMNGKCKVAIWSEEYKKDEYRGVYMLML